MHDDSVLVAVDAALRSPSFCSCGSDLTITVRNDVVWLECVRFAAPARLPDPLATFVRELMHDRRLVIRIPAAQSRGSAPTAVSGAVPVRP
ncbi:MAG: hypothetical protein MUQ32_07650 [Chloroflexi bacterium]|nr:hypothetical protein [Chloroflexota bacterium]